MKIRSRWEDLNSMYGFDAQTHVVDLDVQEEIRVVNAETGGEKGSKMERFDLVPAEPMRQIARHYGVGAEKYSERNWERGYDWSLSIAALERHLNAWKAGEDIDEETGSNHLTAVAFHVLALLQFTEEHPELDDRRTGPKSAVQS